jgi:hypothetical protein
MKNLLFGLIATCFISITSYSQDYSIILKDEEFLSYLEQVAKEQSNIVDTKKVEEYNLDGKIDEYEITDLYKVLGFQSNSDFINSLKSQIERLYSLEKKYVISKISVEDMSMLIDQGFVLLNQNFYFNNHTNLSRKNCGRALRNCLAIAYSTQIAGHIGCATLDVTVIAGLICHGAIVITGAAMEDNCDIDYENCNG